MPPPGVPNGIFILPGSIAIAGLGGEPRPLAGATPEGIRPCSGRRAAME
jgi:hypothetical protein